MTGPHITGPHIAGPHIAGNRKLTFAAITWLILAVTPSVVQAQAQWSVQPVDEPAGWNVNAGDQWVAGYIADSNGKPIVYPIHTPAGKRVVRDFPMLKGNPHERTDHDHHRSMWLTHGDVNGIDFWLDDDHCGRIVQRAGNAKVTDSGSVVITTENDWMDPDGKRVLADTRRFEFYDKGGRRFIDCDFVLKATDGDVNFGDTKEGSFGIRVAGTMKVDAKLGGLITNAEGIHNKEAWGKKSAWVNYSGPVDGTPVGITVHDHPTSFHHPCRWHVRTYGLFAANPFGVHHFTGGPKTDGVVLPKGESLRLNYRVVIYDGPFDANVAAADFKQYASTSRPELD